MPAATNIQALPGALLEAIFQRLALEDRHRTIPLACLCWEVVVHNAHLLSGLHIELAADDDAPQRFLPSLWSLCGCLPQRAAQHATQLELEVLPPEWHHALYAEQLAECIAMLLQARRGLETLELAFGFNISLSSFVALLPKLRCLNAAALCGLSVVRINHSLGHLTALKDCRMDAGDYLDLEPSSSIHLPPRFTSLEIANDCGYSQPGGAYLELPEQVIALSSLLGLKLDHCYYDLDKFSVLTQLCSLMHVWLGGVGGPPPLHKPSSHRSLSIVQHEPEFCWIDSCIGNLEGALPNMYQLEHQAASNGL